MFSAKNKFFKIIFCDSTVCCQAITWTDIDLL